MLMKELILTSSFVSTYVISNCLHAKNTESWPVCCASTKPCFLRSTLEGWNVLSSSPECSDLVKNALNKYLVNAQNISATLLYKSALLKEAGRKKKGGNGKCESFLNDADVSQLGSRLSPAHYCTASQPPSRITGPDLLLFGT